MVGCQEYDNNEQDYQQLYYQKEQDRYFFWVGIRYRYGWDDIRKMPKFMVINPMSWIPDPIPSQIWNFDGSGYRFHWFEFTTTIMELISDGTYDKEALDKVVGSYFSPETHTKQYREILISKLNEYPEWFFPKSRAQFVQFLYKVREVLGEGVLRNFYEVERHSSDVFTYFPYKNTYFVDRHTKCNCKENMPCGHPYTSCCYLDSDKCCHCDAQNIVKFD